MIEHDKGDGGVRQTIILYDRGFLGVRQKVIFLTKTGKFVSLLFQGLLGACEVTLQLVSVQILEGGQLKSEAIYRRGTASNCYDYER